MVWTVRRSGMCLVAVALAVAPAGLVAQSGAQPTRPDFSGYWELRLDSVSAPQADLTPTAASGAAAQARRDAEALSQCVNIGVPALMDDRATLDIRHSPKMLAIMSKTVSSMRYVYTDGRPRPPADEVELTTNGLSIGAWEGDALVVETTSFNNRGVTRIPGGGYRTRNARLTERYRLLDNGQRLSVTFTWQDPTVFRTPHTYEFRYFRVPNISEPRTFRCFQSAERTRFLSGAAPPR